MTDLTDKSVLITGAGRGLGAAMARHIARASAAVWLADIDADAGARVTAELQADGARARFVPVDVADPQSVAAMAAEVTADGPLYGLVNNAALADNVGGREFFDISVEEWDRLHTVNTRGPWLVARAVAGSMIGAGAGRIVNIGSDSALYGSPRLAHYIASKGALIALTRGMARELGAHGITVNLVAPGITETASTRDVPAERHELYRLNRAIERPQQPSDVVGVVTFLLGGEASYLTGQTLPVNGGFVLN